jgi:hypothetical protein
VAPLVRHLFVFFCLTGFLAWFPMVYYYVIVGSAFVQAKKAGELPDIAWGGRGLPVAVLFIDCLPAVRVQRLRLVFWVSVFCGSLVAAFLVGTVFGSKW